MRGLGVELTEDDFLPRVRDNYEGDGVEQLSLYDYWEDYYQESKLDEAKNK